MDEMKYKNTQSAQILECTLRDGSYAVNYRFTYDDTALLCRLLSGLGFKFIEIGHGMGIGASRKGKGKMPGTDAEVVSVARANAGDSSIGMFCIPGIAEISDLKDMRDAGLDFVRIGCDAEDLELALPYLEAARKNNLHTFINFMKSYTISPDDFAAKARRAVDAGAEVVYLVDSAGCMLPSDIGRYFERLADIKDIKTGFHGHNNLHLAVANSLKAIECGANFADTTLYGIGRNAGNASTEVMVAIMKMMGMKLDIEVFDVMEVVDRYILPIMKHFQMYDMLSVTMGYGRFHSGFYPLVKKVADSSGVDVRRLVFLAGRRNPAKISEDELRRYSEELKDCQQKSFPPDDHDISSFSSSRIRKDRISNTLSSVSHLMEELINVASKNHTRILVELLPVAHQDESFISAEYVTSDHEAVMGRIRFGGFERLSAALEILKENMTYILLDNDAQTQWSDNDTLYGEIKKSYDEHLILSYSSRELHSSYICDNLINIRNKMAVKNVLILGPGEPVRFLADRVSRLFEYVFIGRTAPSGQADAVMIDYSTMRDNCVILDMPLEGGDIELNLDMVINLSPLSYRSAAEVMENTQKAPFLLNIGWAETQLDEFSTAEDINYAMLDIARSYEGHFGRWIQISDNLRGRLKSGSIRRGQ
jgi:4-hydroxy-2-oxovalerate aldolase